VSARQPDLQSIAGVVQVAEANVTTPAVTLIEVQIGGTADRMQVSYRSSPPLSESELASLLVAGHASAGAEDFVSGALTAVSSDVLGFAGQFVGLDSVRLGSADLDIVSKERSTAPHLTIAKSFGRARKSSCRTISIRDRSRGCWSHARALATSCVWRRSKERNNPLSCGTSFYWARAAGWRTRK
jgi:hypothetical protein